MIGRTLLFAGLAFAVLAGSCAAAQTEIPIEADALTPGIFLDEEASRALPAGMAMRPVVEKGLAITKASEGWRSRLYNDAALFCTVGYGHLVKKRRCDGSEPPEFLHGISLQAGEVLLKGDLEIAQVAVLTRVSAELSDEQYSALVDFVYNVGTGNFGRSRLLQIVNGGPDRYGEVRDEFARWVKAGGKTLPGLQARRVREADLFFDNVTEPRATVPPVPRPALDIRTGK